MGEITNLNIATGLREFNLNGKVTVTFNPTDPVFIEKVYNTFGSLDDLQDKVRLKSKGATTEELIAMLKELDSEMREMLENLMAVDVCTPLFGDSNVFAMADGLPLWANFLLAIMDVIDENVAESNKLSKKKIAKYMAKYEAEDHKKKEK